MLTRSRRNDALRQGRWGGLISSTPATHTIRMPRASLSLCRAHRLCAVGTHGRAQKAKHIRA